MTRVLLCADLHAGHVLSPLPPRWRRKYQAQDDRFAAAREEAWKWLLKVRKEVAPVDVLVHVGDAIDGRSDRDGGRDVLVPDRIAQTKIAISVLEMFDPRQVYVVYGTPYHTGSLEQYEDLIADHFETEAVERLFLQVEGTVLDCRHTISVTRSPVSHATPLLRERVLAVLAEMRQMNPGAHVIVRAHVHRFLAVSGVRWVAMTLPALLAGPPEYARKRYEYLSDFGVVLLEVEGERFRWHPLVKIVRASAPQPIVVPPRSGS